MGYLHAGLIGRPAEYVYSDCRPGVNVSVYGYTSVDARNEAYANVPTYFRKRDLSFALGGSAGWWGGFAAAGGYGYENTEIGQIIVLAYLDAYKKLVTQLGGYAPAPAK